LNATSGSLTSMYEISFRVLLNSGFTKIADAPVEEKYFSY